MVTRRQTLIGASAAIVAAGLPASPASARRVVIMPDIRWAEHDYKHGRILDVENNWITNVSSIMNRIDFSKEWLEVARVGSDDYREWLAEDPPKDGIPPHIGFGGAIVAGAGDPTFKSRWEEHTRARIAAGEFAW